MRVSYTESMKERSQEIRMVGMQALKDALGGTVYAAI